MTWLAPWALAAGAVAAIAVAALHLLARDRPQRYRLPTARFVAAGRASATRRARTPRDLLLLALRALAILLAAAALAGPVASPRGGSVGRIVLLDAAAARADRPLLDSARARIGEGGRLVLFEAGAQVAPTGSERTWLDSLARDDTTRGVPAPPSLSAALVAAHRAAADIAGRVDSVALVVVSPLHGVEDAATVRIRREWPGRIDAVGVRPRREDTAHARAARLHVSAPAGDPVAAAAALLGASAGGTGGAGDAVRLVRRVPDAGDSAFARAGGTVVAWPDAGTPPGSRADRSAGFVIDGATVLFAGGGTTSPPDGRVVARWIDGRPAIAESSLGAGCLRHVAIDIPAAGDLTLRPAFLEALRSIARPCDVHPLQPASAALVGSLGGDAPLALATSLRREAARSPATPWLLGTALVLLLLELPVRRRSRGTGGEAAT